MDDRTMFEKMTNRRNVKYYPGMHLEGYQPWEIREARHKTMIKEHEARLEEQEVDPPMNVNFNVEVHKR